MMIVAAIILFLFAAVFGLFILTAILKDKPTPKPAVFFHGSLVGIALLLMVSVMATGHVSTLMITSLVLFLLAALGGFTLFVFDISGKPIPKIIAVIHPLIGASALVTLIIAALQNI